MKYTYETKGVCSRKIDVEIDGNVIKEVTFHGGCDGNHKGISAITKGMDVDNVIERFSGISCGMRKTSCPDQLAQALLVIKSKTEKVGE